MEINEFINLPNEVKQVATYDFVNIHITGDTGVGKSELAMAIHNLSPRADKPFVPVSCAEISPSLIESELFGYMKGSFTGATSTRIGKFEEANGGTIFLDEIGELSRDLQAKLLIVIDKKQVTRIGSNKIIPLDIRIISATNQGQGVFRDDFFYRINGYNVHLKPLRERKAEIVPLARKFIEDFSVKFKCKFRCTDDDFECLKLPDWTGNIRQLRDCIMRVCLNRLIYSKDNTEDIQLTSEDFLNTLMQEKLIEIKADNSIFEQPFLSDAKPDSEQGYWQALRLRAFSQADQEFFSLYQKLASENKSSDEIAQAMGICRSTLFYRLKKIRNLREQGRCLQRQL